MIRPALRLALLGAVLGAGAASACIVDLSADDASPPADFLYPNWQRVKTSIFDAEMCDSVTCPPPDSEANITGITILNYGTATGGAAGDLTGMYVCWDCSLTPGTCGPGSAGAMTLTYAGLFNTPSGAKPAWTWAGLTTLAVDPCTTCDCIHLMNVFVDVGPCAAPGNTVVLGPGWDGTVGGVADDAGCDAPFIDIKDPQPKTITWISKIGDKAKVAPGDTVTYTVFYGRPGTGSLSSVQITDSIPPYTHYVNGSGVPPPDAGWDPNPGPPNVLRWTILGPLATPFGPTGEVRFSLTVDWGNGELFEPGSGDVAAPEGQRLSNFGQSAFNGTSCALKGAVSPPVSTVVRRFLFWKVGDNDLLFAPQPGKPADEMTYEIFVRNLSPTKTWWNTQIWDTAPPELDPWAANEGLEDPCNGWTMTPSGCAAASAGRVVAGGQTIMTWAIDLPPGATMTLRWKGQIRPGVTAGGTALNKMSIQEMGRTGIVGGTGNSGFPAIFTHQATIQLPTTYVSYVGFAANGNDKEGCPGFFIDFFPLNKQTQFELRAIQYEGGGWSTAGGVSQSIGCLVGDCLGGFPGDAACGLGAGAIPGGGVSGCKIERTPAVYDPTGWQLVCPTYPIDFIYKVVSNSPVLWQLLTHMSHDAQDSDTWAPSTSITYRGFMHYMWRRAGMDTAAGDGDALSLINTGLDGAGVLQPNQGTTVHLFEFDYGTLTWDYMDTYELGPESQAIDLGPDAADENPWRTISSDTQLVVYEGCDTISQAFCCCGCGDNYVSFGPTRETGNVVSQVGSGTFYGIVPGWAGNKIVVGNVGAATANYRLWRYNPDNAVPVGNIPGTLADTSGTWSLMLSDFCPAGLANVANPQIYGAVLNAAGYSLWKVELTGGGPIQVLYGANLFQGWSGGAVMQASNGNQTGTQYWLHTIAGGGGPCGPVTQVVNVFAPKTGTAIQGQAENGYSATYTTNGPDQCVAFLAITNAATKVNYQFNSLTGSAAIAQFIMCKITEKGYTAPFLQTGNHYTIIAPPVVFLGQSFWITLVVLDSSQTTKTDYCGTTSFTSTDPFGQLEGGPMDAYNFTWMSNIGAGCGAGPYQDGVHVFVNVTFTRLGVMTIVASDTTDGSITGLTAVLVVGVDVKLTKSPRLSVAASGDTVQFRICWSNYSSASAFSFTITDAVPMGTTYVPDLASNHLCGFSGAAVPVDVAYSLATSTAPPPPASFLTTGGALPVGVRWLRWTIKPVNVYSTGCVCFKVSVN